MSIDDKVTEIKQSIGLYDLFGYLLPGFFFYALFIIDYDGAQILRYFDSHKCLAGIENQNYSFKMKYLMDFIYYKSSNSFGLITFFIFVIFCYLSGHIMASYSSFIAKHTIRRVFRSPVEYLFAPIPSDIIEQSWHGKTAYFVYSWINKIFGDALRLSYRKPFDISFRKEFNIVIESTFKYKAKVPDYYWLVYSYICAQYPYCVKRIQHFINLSGFARNIAGTFSFYIIFRLLLYYLLGSKIDIYVCVILTSYLLLSIIMVWTYLRLYKRQAVDMFYMFYSLQLNKIDK